MPTRDEMMRRQEALAEFGDFVLDHEDLDGVLNEGCRLIAEALGTDLAKVIEIERNTNTGFVRAGVGWRPGIVGHERVRLSERSSEAYAIEKTEPVITNDVASEKRFEFPSFLRDHGVIALVNVPILLPGRRPWGVLQVDAREPRQFDDQSIKFLKTYSMVLGPVIDRLLVAAEREQARSGLAVRDERQAFLLALGDAMRAEGGAREKVEVAARRLGERLSATRVLFAEFDEAQGIADIFGGWSADGLPAFPAVMRLEDHEGPVMDDLRAGRTVRIDDVRRLVDQPAFAAIVQVGVGALLSVPLLVDDKLLVNLSVHQQEARRWTDAEVALVQEVAERLWAEVVRARAEASLGASEERYRDLFERIDEGFCIIEVLFEGEEAVDYRFLDVNPAFERQTGIAEGKGRLMRDIAPEHEQHWFGIYGEIALTGEPRRFEARADALGRWYSVYAFRVDEPERRRVGILFDDVTERTKTESALRESEARLSAAFESVPVGLAVIDTEGKIVLANAEYRRFLPTGLMPSRDPEHGHRWQAWDEQKNLISASQFPGARALNGETVVPGLDMLHVDDDGCPRWTNVATAPTFDSARNVTGFVSVISDIDTLKRSTDALRDSEERFRLILESVRSYAIFTTDRDGIITSWPAGAAAVYGWSEAEMVGRSMDLTFVPEDVASGAPEEERRTAAREGWAPNVRWHMRKDGSRIFINGSTQPLLSADRKIREFIKIGEDITEDRRIQQALAENEERLRSAVEVGRLGLWDWNVLTGEIHWSDEHFRMEGYSVGEVKPSYEAWASRIHPDDRRGAETALRHAQEAHEDFDHEFRTVHPDGIVRWLHGRGRFFYDEMGQAVRMVGAMTDFTARREWEDRQQVLVAELQHRTRNLMGVVRSMSDKTARTSADLADFRSRFRDRLDALARVQGLLSRLNDPDRVTFDELIRTELAAMDGGSDRATLDGPVGIRLRSSTVQTLAMALHELATNALKYGALGQPQARLAVTWTLEQSGAGGKPWLHIDWRESGVDIPPAGARLSGTGQGRELIEHALPYQLSAKTTYRLRPGGVHCTISIPVSDSTKEVVASLTRP